MDTEGALVLVGVLDGDEDGEREGNALGSIDGSDDGSDDALGTTDGSDDGSDDDDGEREGSALGTTDGSDDGSDDGEREGILLTSSCKYTCALPLGSPGLPTTKVFPSLLNPTLYPDNTAVPSPIKP